MSEFEEYAKAKAHSILKAKNIAPLLKTIATLPHIPSRIHSDNGIHITALDSTLPSQHSQMLHSLALQLKPWRKGGFHLFDLHIDSEWQSFIKWQLLAPHCELSSKHIADIGCNNGYYMFEMLLHKQKMLNFYESSKLRDDLPKSIIGFDPSGIFKCQFEFLNHFIKAPIEFELLGVEDLPQYCQSHKKAFDVIFCLGVLYHRLSPIETLKALSQCLEPRWELILDTLIYESNQELCLSPAKSYAKMSNVYFIPSIPTLQGWCERAKFKHFEVLTLMPTTTQEQRQTPWVDSQSLESFLQQDKTLTIEGYQAPMRGYFKLKKE